MKNYVKNKDLYGTVIPSKNDNTWELNKYVKSDKMAYIIFAATDSFLKKNDGCANNPGNLQQQS